MAFSHVMMVSLQACLLQSPLELEVSMVDTVVGGPATLKVHLKNTSSEPITVILDQLDDGLKVLDPIGWTWRPNNRLTREVVGPGVREIVLKPGECASEHHFLHHLFRITSDKASVPFLFSARVSVHDSVKSVAISSKVLAQAEPMSRVVADRISGIVKAELRNRREPFAVSLLDRTGHRELESSYLLVLNETRDLAAAIRMMRCICVSHDSFAVGFARLVALRESAGRRFWSGEAFYYFVESLNDQERASALSQFMIPEDVVDSLLWRLATRTFASAPERDELLKQIACIPPPKGIQHLRRLFEGLSDSEFKEREDCQRAIVKLGVTAEPGLGLLLSGTNDPETLRRCASIRDIWDDADFRLTPHAVLLRYLRDRNSAQPDGRIVLEALQRNVNSRVGSEAAKLLKMRLK